MRPIPTLAAAAVLALACGGGTRAADSAATAAAGAAPGAAAGDGGTPAASVTAPMRDASGRDLGTVTLAESAEGITVSGSLRGVPPGEHAIHVHTTGKCDPPGFTTAGGHWNPTARKHGAQNPEGPHLGDMPNVTVGADSAAAVRATTPGGTLRGENGLLDADGAAVVLHARADDYKTDPAGNAGDRVACGVVGGS